MSATDGYARGLASLTFADNYRDNLKDDQQALEAYAYAHAIEEKRDRYGWMCFTSVASAAGVHHISVFWAGF